MLDPALTEFSNKEQQLSAHCRVGVGHVSHDCLKVEDISGCHGEKWWVVVQDESGVSRFARNSRGRQRSLHV